MQGYENVEYPMKYANTVGIFFLNYLQRGRFYDMIKLTFFMRGPDYD